MSSTLSLGEAASELKRSVASKERQVDSKITQYAALADALESAVDADEYQSSVQLRSEIEQLLDELRALVRQLANTPPQQQHWGRLQTYTQDFLRVRARVTDAWNAAQLLQRTGAASSASGARGASSAETQALLDEQHAARGAHRAADRVLAQAAAAHADLEAQNARVASLGSRLSNIARAVPGLNSLMTRIRGRRERDRYIMAACIGTCITLIVVYELLL